jgi:hypothetical protein
MVRLNNSNRWNNKFTCFEKSEKERKGARRDGRMETDHARNHHFHAVSLAVIKYSMRY